MVQGQNSGRKEILKVKPVNGKKPEKVILEHKGQVISYFDYAFLCEKDRKFPLYNYARKFPLRNYI